MARRRGNGSRGRAVVSFRGLGTSGRQGPARRGQAIEPRSMSTQMVTGSADPPDTPDNVVFTRSLLGNSFGFVGSTATQDYNMNNILSYEALVTTGSNTPRFNEARLLRVEIWDSAANEATDTPLLLVFSAAFGNDGGTFRDFSTPGQRRAHVAVRPSFTLRDTWIGSSDTTTLFTISGSSASASASPIVRLTLQMR
jgi:hypothetical protein